MERQDVWNAAKRRQNAARMQTDLDLARSSPPSVQISCRNLCRKSCRKGFETPLAAGLAASAGGLGSLEALAVHPWAQESLYSAICIHQDPLCFPGAIAITAIHVGNC